MWEQIPKKNKFESGVLFKDLPVFNVRTAKNSFQIYEYSLLITQACDIESYFLAKEKMNIKVKETSVGEIGNLCLDDRQIITQLIFIPLFEEESFKKGTHLFNQIGCNVKALSSKESEKFQKNENYRYHYLTDDKNPIHNFFIDFKQYFTLPIDFVVSHINESKDKYVYKLMHIYFTDLSDRFSHYLQRVAIP